MRSFGRFAMFLVISGLAVPASWSADPPPALLEFHSGFWMNLHHALYNQAADPNLPRPALEGAEREVWDAALDYYRTALIHRDLLFDEQLSRVKKSLAERETADSPGPLEALPELTSVLERAAPVYRKHLWPEDDKLNRAWIAATEQLVAAHGQALASKLATVYQVPWPERPVRMDVVPIANWAGAYTSENPTHTVISSTDRGYLGQNALEMVFHEASHGLMQPLLAALSRSLEARHKWLPRRDLWHAVLFYTAGELARRELGGGYNPVADELFTRVWPMYREPLERLWKPYLDGLGTLQEAADRLVADVGIEPQTRTPPPRLH